MPSKYIPLWNNTDDLFKRPEPTVACEKCGKLFRAENEEMVWAIGQPKYKNYCHDCHYKAINENPSEEQLREWAEESINSSQHSMNWEIPEECSYENFNDKVRPIIDEILQKKEEKRKRDCHQKKIDEAISMIEAAHLTRDKDGVCYDYHGQPVLRDDVVVFINVIATLLERIEDLEEKASDSNIWNERFGG